LNSVDHLRCLQSNQKQTQSQQQQQRQQDRFTKHNKNTQQLTELLQGFIIP